MNQFVVYDVSNYAWFEVVSNKLRQTNADVHDITLQLVDMPVSDWSSPINQIWSAGLALTKLADMVSGKVVTDGSEFIINTELTCLAEGITMLMQSQNITCKITHWTHYK